MKKTVIISVLFFIALTVSASANNSGEHKDLKALNNIANQVLELGKQENYEQAKKVLNNFPTLFLKQTSENQLSMAQVKMIIHTYEKAEEAVTRVQMNLDERIHYLTQFRLAVDALSSVELTISLAYSLHCFKKRILLQIPSNLPGKNIISLSIPLLL